MRWAAGLFRTLFRTAYGVRRLEARFRDHPAAEPLDAGDHQPGSRNILFITVDQQRFDALGVNGGQVARTPTLDGLAAGGINYRRAHVQNVV